MHGQRGNGRRPHLGSRLDPFAAVVLFVVAVAALAVERTADSTRRPVS